MGNVSRKFNGDILTMKMLTGICAAALIAASAALTVVTPANATPAGSYSGDVLIRAGIAGVLPNSKFDVIDQAPGLGVDQAEVDDAWVPHLTISYFLNKNLAVELFCCFAQHGAQGQGNLAGTELGETMIFPPALTLQYHFDSMNGFKPYVGAGVQYIHFFDTTSSIGGTLDIDDAFGFVLQGGADFELGNGFYLNADIKYTFLETEANFRNTALAPALDVDFDLDPLIVSFALGYRFNLFNSPAPAPYK